MFNPSWLKLVCVGCILAPFAGWQSARAASLNEGTISATAGLQTPSTANFSTSPYLTPVMSTGEDAMSTTTPDVTGLVFKGTFAQTVNLATPAIAVATPAVVAPAFAASMTTADGSFQIDFNANGGDTYTLFGGETPTNGTGALTVSLYDNTTSTSIYSYSNSGTGIVTADTSGGSTAGVLAAGDYTFNIDASFEGDEVMYFGDVGADTIVQTGGLTGSGGITLVSTGAVPEPATPILLILGGIAVLISGRRRARPL